MLYKTKTESLSYSATLQMTAQPCFSSSAQTRSRKSLPLQQGLDQYWNSIQQSLSTSRTRQGEQTLFNELENQPGKVLDLAARIDALNQASLARKEQESEYQQTKLRQLAIAATLMLLLLECAIAIFSTAYMYRLTRSQRQRGSAPRRRNKSSGVYRTN